MLKKRKRSIKAYKRRIERRKTHRTKKPLKEYRDLNDKFIAYDLKEEEENHKITMRTPKSQRKEMVRLIQYYDDCQKKKIYFRHLSLRKYRRKLKYKKKKRSIRRVKTYLKKLFYYPDRKIQPIWVYKKIAYMLSTYRMFKHAFENSTSTTLKNKLKLFQLKNKNNTSKILKKRKTFRYNNSSCTFVITPKEVSLAKSYKNISKKTYPMLKKVRNLLWRIIHYFKHKLKKSRKKARYLRFKIRMLSRLTSYKKYHYRKKNLYKKVNKKNKRIKRIKIKTKSRIKKIRINVSKKSKIQHKTKHIIKMLKKIKKNNNRKRRSIQQFLHYIKYKTLSVNQVLKRKKRKKFYWLTNLYYTKKDISNALCLQIVHKPLLLQRLYLQNNTFTKPKYLLKQNKNKTTIT